MANNDLKGRERLLPVDDRSLKLLDLRRVSTLSIGSMIYFDSLYSSDFDLRRWHTDSLNELSFRFNYCFNLQIIYLRRAFT